MEDSRQFLRLITPGGNARGIASHNTNERMHREQMDGTAIAALGRLCDVVMEVDNDDTGLARWSWIKLGMGAQTTRIISGYLPCKPGKTSRGRTVWEQQARYFQARGNFKYPSMIFIKDMTSLVTLWHRAGEEVMLLIDSNQDVYTGPLAKALSKEGSTWHA